MLALKDSALNQRLQNEGFCTIGLVEPDDAQALYRELRRLGDGKPGSWDPSDHRAPIYVSILDNDIERRDTSHELVEQLLTPAIDRIFDDHRILECSVIAKDAGQGPTPLHQHAPAVDDAFETSFLIWCALSDVDEANGAMIVIPRSQRVVRHIRTYDTTEYFEHYVEELQGEFGVAVPLKAGEALVMNNNLIHAAFANGTERTRIAAASLVVERGSRHAIYRLEEGKIAALDPLTDDFSTSGTRDFKLREWKSEIRHSYPDWRSTANFAQIKALMQMEAPPARADFDPLSLVDHLATPPASALLVAMDESHLRRAAKRIPGMRSAYRLATRLLGQSVNRE